MNAEILPKMTRILFIGVVLSFVLLMWIGINTSTTLSAEVGTNYYVDATNGDDDNDGLSPETAWKTLNNVNDTTFEPGDKILLKSGERWEGQLSPKGSGMEGQPIIIDKFGQGSLPLLEGNGEVDSTVKLKNQEYWEINNLEITNTAPIETTLGESLGDYRGIYVTGSDAGTLRYIRINGVHVHSVSGEVNWIRGSIPSNPQPGINFQTGWDRSKRTGGIVFDAWVEDHENPQPTQFEDIIIENSILEDNSFTSISIKQYVGDKSPDPYTGWGSRDSVYGTPDFKPHKNVTIKNNYISHYNSNYAANGMYVTGVQGALIEHNVVAGAGTSGIEIYYADDVVVQYNEVFDTRRKAGGADHNGIGPDRATTNIIVQYNYIYNTGDGILLSQFSFGDLIVRNNIIENASRYPIYLHSNRDATAEVYNNTIYQNNNSQYLIYGYGSYVEATYNIKNNILYSTNENAILTTGGGINYENNSYYGGSFAIPSDDPRPITLDPLMVNPGPVERNTDVESGPILDVLEGYGLQSGSPLIDAGLEIINNGGKDFIGNDLYNGGADLGAIEYYGDTESQYESITGTVRDYYGNPLREVTVSLRVDDEVYSTATNENGFYSIKNVPVGTHEVTASRDEYETETITVELTSLNTAANQDITIASISDYGSIKGVVLDHRGQPVANVSVTVFNNKESYDSLTNELGEYFIENILIGYDYTVKASKDNYISAEVEEIRVLPGYETTVPDLFLGGTHPEYLIIDDFNDNETGSLPADWEVSQSGGSISIDEIPGSTDKSVTLTRHTNSGRTSLSKHFGENVLTGIVTVDFDVMRDDHIFSGNSWISLPYIFGHGAPASAPGISIAMDKGNIIAYEGGSSKTVMQFEQGEWYNFQIIMNTTTQTYDLFINGEQIFTNAPFRNQMNEIGQVEFYANSSNYGTAHINNFRLISGSPYEKNENSLESLSISHGTLNHISENRYTVSLPYDVEEITLTPTAYSIFSKININDIAVRSGVESDPIRIEEGENVISIVVVAEDGSERIYEVIVNRMSGDLESRLQSIIVSEGELSPEFQMDTHNYYLEVPYETDSLLIEAIAIAPRTLISIQNSEMMVGEASKEVSLNVGDNQIRIWVESADGTADKEYILLITREQGETPPGDGDDGEVSLPLIRNTLDYYKEDGALQTPLYRQLSNRIEQVEHHKNKGRDHQAIKHMQDFLEHLNNGALQGYISEEAHAILEKYARDLIEQLESE